MCDQIRRRKAVLPQLFCRKIPRKAVQINSGTGGKPRLKALGKQGAEHAGQHVPAAALGHGRAAGRVDGDLVFPADKGAAALEDQDDARVFLHKAQRARKAALREIPAEALKLSLMRGKDQRRGEAVEKSRIIRKDTQRVRIHNRRAVGAAQYIPGKRFGL